MRVLPKNISDFLYLISKIRLSFFRGLLLKPFFAKNSHFPFIDKNTTLIFKHKITFGKFVWLGKNGYLDACSKNGVVFGNNSTIRENFVIQCRSGLNEKGHSLIVGKETFIGPFCKIGVGGPIVIGNDCQFGSHCSLNAESHISFQDSYTSGHVSRQGIFIGNNVWVGDGVIILDGVTIGDNCVIGAGSLVNKSLPKNSLAFGVPAKVQKKLKN